MRFVFWSRGVVLACVALCVLSACSKGSSSDPSAAGLTGTPIKIGQIDSIGTASLNNTDNVAVAKASVAAINKAGGIKGHPIEIDFCNSQASAPQEQACARQMVRDNVMATMRDLTPFAGSAVTDVLGQAKVARVFSSALSSAEFSAPNAFPIDGGTAFEMAAGIAWAGKNGHHNAYMVASQTGTTDIIEGQVKSAASTSGVQLVGTDRIPLSNADYAPVVEKIMRANPDVVLLPLVAPSIVQITKGLKQAGSKAVVLINGGALTHADFQKLGSAGEGMMVFGPVPPLSAAPQFPEVAALKTALEQAAPTDPDVPLDDPKQSAMQTWYAIKTIVAVASKIDKFDSATFLKAMQDYGEITIGPLTYSPPPPAGPVAQFPQVTNMREYVMTVKNGEQVLAQPEPIDLTQSLR